MKIVRVGEPDFRKSRTIEEVPMMASAFTRAVDPIILDTIVVDSSDYCSKITGHSSRIERV